MKFNNLNDAIKATNTIKRDFKKSDRKIIHFPVLFKRALMEFAEASKIDKKEISNTLEINLQNILRWEEQYTQGLYKLDGAYCVSKTSKSLNRTILETLQQQLIEVTNKIELIKQCEALGLKVTK